MELSVYVSGKLFILYFFARSIKPGRKKYDKLVEKINRMLSLFRYNDFDPNLDREVFFVKQEIPFLTKSGPANLGSRKPNLGYGSWAKNRNFGQKWFLFGSKWKFWLDIIFVLLLSKIDILVKNRHYCQKSKFLSKIDILVKNRHYCQKSKFCQKSTF